MGDIERNRQIIEKLHKIDLSQYKNLSMLMDMCIAVKDDDLELAINESKFVKRQASIGSRKDVRFMDLYYKSLLLLAPYDFDSYCIYLEKNREPKERFYLPRRKQLRDLGLIQALQELEDDELDILSISMPPGTAKTTLNEFFTSWVIGRHQEYYNLFSSHSGDITRMFYDAVNQITSNPEYTWSEIFPGVKKESENAKMETINFGKFKPFKSLQCRSIDSKNAGVVRCNGYLICDDLIGGIEEALSKPRLDKLWTKYSVDLRQRKKDGCKELHIATRWSVHDVIGRLKRLYDKTGRAKFIAVPDINEKTGKSNFEYDYGVGFTVEYFNDMANTMDDISYKCLFKNQPIEREGLLYNEDELRRFVSLPDREPDAIIGICDTKDKGSDFMFLPAVYKYGEDYYCVDCVCDDNTDYGVQYQRCAKIILDYKLQQCEFESNNGGSRVGYEVNKLVEAEGGRCNITTKPTETNKETRIIVNADWVKKHVLFKDSEQYKPKDDYGVMMGWLLSYSTKGKNEHDDVPDGWANFALFVQNLFGGRRTAVIMDSPV